jgi:hypothetical protein
MCSPWTGADVFQGGDTWNAIPGNTRPPPGGSRNLMLLPGGTYKKAKNIRKKNLFL